ncbi:MAG TPA: response regulator [Bryobacteraceae bacterium]|nr:response regulator [Bryobacteraceae bacterium]
MPDSQSASHPSVTILVVDDEDTVLALVRTMLWRAGYTVLEAPGAEEALHLASEHAGSIDLLVSDVLMPGTNGYALADSLTAVRPETKVLFMSGYRDKVLSESTGRASSEAPLLRKPFTQYALISKIQELLDAQSADAGAAAL